MGRFPGLILSGCMSVFAFSCASIPSGARAVEAFNSTDYLGKWYEVARFDFRFEKNLDNTTAEYSLNADGTIKVTNRGYDYVKRQWRQAVGKARFKGSPTIARLEVSFFGPFYAGYNVIMLDSDYRYALIAGQNLKYLWILSRETAIPEAVRTRYLAEAQRIGYDVEKLIWVEHDKREE
jgi:apolipoprotein D and lipocalin family protein